MFLWEPQDEAFSKQVTPCVCTDGCLRLAWSELGVVEPYLRLAGNEGMEKKMEATGIIGICMVEGI